MSKKKKDPYYFQGAHTEDDRYVVVVGNGRGANNKPEPMYLMEPTLHKSEMGDMCLTVTESLPDAWLTRNLYDATAAIDKIQETLDQVDLHIHKVKLTIDVDKTELIS